MKRLIMLAVLCAFVLSAAAASASELKASGYIKGDAVWKKNWDFADGNDAIDEEASRKFDIQQRIEFDLQFVASETLKAVFTARVNQTWGDAGAASLGDAPTDAIQVRKAYLDFMWPGTEVAVKVGFQGLALPYAVAGSLLLDSRVGALVVSSPITDNFALTGLYARPVRSDNALSQMDLYGLIANIDAGENVNLKPFIVMAGVGTNTVGTAGLAVANGTNDVVDSAYWLGLSGTASFGGINFGGDLNYGNVSGDDSAFDRSGWAFLASASYAMDMFTPEAFFAYTTGEDDDDNNGSERMPQLAEDWALGSFFFGGDGWLDGSLNGGATPLGFWALGVTLNDIASFNENMYHIVHLIYAKGTNDKDSGVTAGAYGSVLTEEDSMIEFDFNTYYKVYDELVIGLELGYVNLNADEDVWGADGGSAYKVSTGLKYSF